MKKLSKNKSLDFNTHRGRISRSEAVKMTLQENYFSCK